MTYIPPPSRPAGIDRSGDILTYGLGALGGIIGGIIGGPPGALTGAQLGMSGGGMLGSDDAELRKQYGKQLLTQGASVTADKYKTWDDLLAALPGMGTGTGA